MSDIFGLLVLLGGALGLAIAAIAIFAVLLDAEGRWRQHTSPFILGTIIFAISLGTLFSGRNVSLAGEDLTDVANAGSGISTWLLRLCTLAVVGTCAARLGAAILRREQSPDAGSSLLAAFLCFFVSNSIINAFLGTHPAFVHGIYYALVVFIAAFLGRAFPPQSALIVSRNGLLAFMLLSFIVAAVKPELAVQRNYVGFIPGLSIRFWGLGSNPNSIGPLAAILILISLLAPFRNRGYQWASILISTLVLLLSQSKTAWLALLVALCVVSMHRLLARNQSPQEKYDRALIIGLIFCASGILLIASYALLDIDYWLNRALATKTGEQLSTLTGRAAIWKVAISAWQDNPLFGYGVTMWDLYHRYQIGMPFAYSAHNQWLQALGAAGTLGLIGLLIYMLIALKYAWRARQATRGISLGLMAFLLFRCITETPLETDTLFNGDTLTHLLTFVILLAYGSHSNFVARGTAK